MTENKNICYHFLLNIPLKYFVLYISSVTKFHLFAGAVLVSIHCLSKQLHEGTSRLMFRNWNSCSKKRFLYFRFWNSIWNESFISTIKCSKNTAFFQTTKNIFY